MPRSAYQVREYRTAEKDHVSAPWRILDSEFEFLEKDQYRRRSELLETHI